jgi:hypothetical protein
MTASAEPERGRGDAPKPHPAAASARPSTPSRPTRATPRTPDPQTTQRRTAEPEQRSRHWHPAVPGMGAAVPAARALLGGGRC